MLSLFYLLDSSVKEVLIFIFLVDLSHGDKIRPSSDILIKQK